MSSGKANLNLCLTVKKKKIPQKCNILLLGYRLPRGESPTLLPPPSDTSHGHSHLSSLPYSLLRGQGRQADWLSTKKYFSCSFILSLQGGTPPSSAPNKTGFLYQPHSNSKVPKHYVKGAFISASSTHPACPPARPPAPVCPHDMPSTLSDINNAMLFSRHSQSDL